MEPKQDTAWLFLEPEKSKAAIVQAMLGFSGICERESAGSIGSMSRAKRVYGWVGMQSRSSILRK